MNFPLRPNPGRVFVAASLTDIPAVCRSAFGGRPVAGLLAEALTGHVRRRKLCFDHRAGAVAVWASRIMSGATAAAMLHEPDMCGPSPNEADIGLAFDGGLSVPVRKHAVAVLCTDLGVACSVRGIFCVAFE